MSSTLLTPLTITIPRELVFSEVVEDVVSVGRLEPLSASLSWLPGTGWNSCGEQLFQEARSTRASAGAEPWKALSSVQLVELELHAPLAQQATPPPPRPRGRPGWWCSGWEPRVNRGILEWTVSAFSSLCFLLSSHPSAPPSGLSTLPDKKPNWIIDTNAFPLGGLWGSGMGRGNQVGLGPFKTDTRATLDVSLYTTTCSNSACLHIFQQKAYPVRFFLQLHLLELWKPGFFFLPLNTPPFPNSLSFRFSLAVLALCSKFWPLTESWNFPSLSKFDYRWVSLLLIMVLSRKKVHFLICTTYRVL